MKTFNQFCENIDNNPQPPKVPGRLKIKKDKDNLEWIVAFYFGNKLDEDKTYYSGGNTKDYYDDCVNTAKAMQKDLDMYNKTGKWR